MKTASKWLAVTTVLLLVGCEQERAEEMVGTLERNQIHLTFESNEPISEIHVQDGQLVSQGELLLTQDASRFQIQLAKLEAERDRIAARLAELERGPREESIRRARALLESAQAETRNAQAELNRIQSVFDQGLSTSERLDRAETRFATAQSQETASRESLDTLLNGTTIEELQQAAAALQAANASVNEAQLAIDRTRLTAPVDGRVDKVLARIGERPIPGETQIVFLDSARTYARVYIPEYLKTSVTPGNTIRIQIDGESTPHNGTVRWVSADASFTPYFALTEHDRSRLSYVAEIDIPSASDLPTGVPLVALPPQSP